MTIYDELASNYDPSPFDTAAGRPAPEPWPDDVPMGDDGPLDFYLDDTRAGGEPPAAAPKRQTVPPPVRKRGNPFDAGTRPTAVLVDIDGTLDTKAGLDWAREQHRRGHVLIIVTARNHRWDYARSFRQCRQRLGDTPFIGPICRADDDMRYACDFKLHVYQSLSLMFDIVAAIDDDRWVLATYEGVPGLEAVPCHPLRTHSRGTLDRADYPRNMPWDR